MAKLAPQEQAKQLEQCIKDCTSVVNDLQNLTQQAHDVSLESTIKESIHHLEMCIQECNYASKAVL